MNPKTWTLFNKQICGILIPFKIRIKLVETTGFVKHKTFYSQTCYICHLTYVEATNILIFVNSNL